MPKTREIQRRIANVKNIKQITKAMNAIAMAKLTKMKKRLKKTEKYVETMEDTARKLAPLAEKSDSPLLEAPEEGSVGILVLNSDRGLCGRYKNQINRSARDFINSREEPVELHAGGEKGYVYFRKYEELRKKWVNFYINPDYEKARKMASFILNRTFDGKIREFWVVYFEFVSDLNQNLQVEKILPLELEGNSKKEEYVTEPPGAELVEDFLVKYFESRIFRVIMETKTSEHAIRRTAMRDATNNADELIDELTTTYNKARQQQITREVADIMGGAEALREEDS